MPGRAILSTLGSPKRIRGGDHSGEEEKCGYSTEAEEGEDVSLLLFLVLVGVPLLGPRPEPGGGAIPEPIETREQVRQPAREDAAPREEQPVSEVPEPVKPGELRGGQHEEEERPSARDTDTAFVESEEEPVAEPQAEPGELTEQPKEEPEAIEETAPSPPQKTRKPVAAFWIVLPGT